MPIEVQSSIVQALITALKTVDILNLSQTYIAGEALAKADIVYLTSAGEVKKAQNDGTFAEQQVFGVARTATILGNSVRVIIRGVTDVFSGLTIGDVYYLDSTAGAITNVLPTTAGNVVYRVGIADTAVSINFKPELIVVRG